jgi:hypothetical protein
MGKNSKKERAKLNLFRHKVNRRCRVETFNVDLPNGKYQKYQVVYNTNLSLISIYPEVSAKLMSSYRGTSPALLPALIQDIQDEVLGL